jgi:DNA-directed RNA polymerase specialized sigma subunit
MGVYRLTAFEYLNQVKVLDSLIINKTIEQEQLRELAEKITQANDGMPHASGVSDKIGNAVAGLVDLQNETAVLVAAFKSVLQDVIKHIEMLPEEQYSILHCKFIRKREDIGNHRSWYYSWEEVAEIVGYSESQVYRIKKKALRNLQRILDDERMTVNDRVHI